MISMSQCIIYILKNTVNSKVYVGQTWQSLKARWNCRYDCCIYLNNAIEKYGKDKFYYELLAVASDQETANYLEQSYIEEYKSTNSEYGYNILSGGNNSRRSEELKKKVSEACQGINAKLDETKAMEIFRDPRSQKEIMEDYNVSQTTVSDIKNGRSWTWLTGKNWNNSRIDDAVVLGIFNAQGTYGDIAKYYGTNRRAVGNIKNGIIYSWLTGKTHKKVANG
jgi:molybdopterin converting factor small subunit